MSHLLIIVIKDPVQVKDENYHYWLATTAKIELQHITTS